MPEEWLEHVWDLFVGVCKNRMDFFLIYLFLRGKISRKIELQRPE